MQDVQGGRKKPEGAAEELAELGSKQESGEKRSPRSQEATMMK
jgi:hypothetical protein